MQNKKLDFLKKNLLEYGMINLFYFCNNKMKKIKMIILLKILMLVFSGTIIAVYVISFAAFYINKIKFKWFLNMKLINIKISLINKKLMIKIFKKFLASNVL